MPEAVKANLAAIAALAEAAKRPIEWGEVRVQEVGLRYFPLVHINADTLLTLVAALREAEKTILTDYSESLLAEHGIIDEPEAQP